jgi:PEP-CTERM motif
MKTTIRTKTIQLTLMAILIVSSAAIATADTVTFSGLPGPTDSPFTTYTEGTFTVSSVGGNWFQGLIYGNPAPSIYDGPIGQPGDATVEVTDSAGLFTFSSLDYSSNNGPGRYDIKGMLGATMEFDQTGALVGSFPPFGFTTLDSLFPNTQIDSLFIEVFPSDGVTSINLDNIVVNTVAGTTPEPNTWILFGTGLAGLLARRKLSR